MFWLRDNPTRHGDHRYVRVALSMRWPFIHIFNCPLYPTNLSAVNFWYRTGEVSKILNLYIQWWSSPCSGSMSATNNYNKLLEKDNPSEVKSHKKIKDDLKPNRLTIKPSLNAYVCVSAIYLNLTWCCLTCHATTTTHATATPNRLCKTLLSVFGLRFYSKLHPMSMVQGIWMLLHTYDHDEERGKLIKR